MPGEFAEIIQNVVPKRHNHPDSVEWIFKRPDVYGILRVLRVQQAKIRPFQR